MPVVTESDVAAAFRAMFDAHTPADPEPALAAFIPGGLWYGKTPQEQPDPYAALTVAQASPEYNSSSTYLHIFTVTVTVWTRQAATATGKLKAAISTVFNRRRIASELTVPNADKVVDVRAVAPSGEGLAEDGGYQEQMPVVAARLSFEVTVQATME